ncbi:hypothetical protein ACLQ3C_20445 [Gordonia sp. DT30]|uniref:PPE domain-containing protein n=1 Tax=Gordonia sp. DT30 TaxID=3416546 RepID=UPI003CF0120F
MGNPYDDLVADAIGKLNESRRQLSSGSVGQRRMDRNMNRLTREARPEGKVYQPSPVKGTDWRSKSYDQMKAVKDSFDGKQSQLDEISGAWEKLGEKWATEMEHYNTAVSKITASSWTGDTAQSASTAVTGFVGDFPEGIRDYANEMSDRMAGLAANFRFAATNFPPMDDDTTYGEHHFTGETWFGLSDYYQHIPTTEIDEKTPWTWGSYLSGIGDEQFVSVKGMVDKVFKATSQAADLLAKNYSTPLQESVQNLTKLHPAGPAPADGPGGPMPAGIPTPGGGGPGGGGTGGGGGGAQPVSAPDLNRSLEDLMKENAAQNVDRPSATDNPLSQIGNTAAATLSSMGSQASQAAQQAMSQAQQAAEQLAKKTAGGVPNVVEPTGFPGGITPVSSPTAGGGGSGRGAGGGGVGSGAPSATNTPSERTTKTGTTKSTLTSTRPSAGIAQAAQGTTGSGGGAPGAGGRGAGGGGDKVHKVLKALRTRVNGEEIAGPDITPAVEGSAIEGGEQATPSGDDGTRT